MKKRRQKKFLSVLLVIVKILSVLVYYSGFAAIILWFYGYSYPVLLISGIAGGLLGTVGLALTTRDVDNNDLNIS